MDRKLHMPRFSDRDDLAENDTPDLGADLLPLRTHPQYRSIVTYIETHDQGAHGVTVAQIAAALHRSTRDIERKLRRLTENIDVFRYGPQKPPRYGVY